jgi:prolyl-tRNA synthetase
VVVTETPDQPAQIHLLMVRGDHELNEIKLGKLPGFESGFRLANEAEIVSQFGASPGSLGPVGFNDANVTPIKSVRVIADLTVANMHDFVVGANESDFHLQGVNWARDLPEPSIVADIRNVVEGDQTPSGQGKLSLQRGIEVGHVFYLGTKYSKALNATFLDETGKPALLEMGCYGIGVTRIVGAAIEQRHDDRGIIWPRAIAPFEVVICALGWGKSEAVREASLNLYNQLLSQGVDVILDDRDQRPGVMFAEWELIGVPIRLTIGDRSISQGQIEILQRAQGEMQLVSIDDAAKQVLDQLAQMSI